MSNVNNTIEYYNHNFKEYISSTIDADMSETYEKFLMYVKPGSHIIDIGCGSGRDSKYFIDKGFRITAIDGSKQFCEYASKYIGQDVINCSFEEISYVNQFDAAWACASLLHIPKNKMEVCLRKISNSLKENGILYVSYKYGTDERMQRDRLFSDYTEKEIPILFSDEIDMKCIVWWISNDVRPGRESERWLNIIAKKI